jgi:hypothetical protein
LDLLQFKAAGGLATSSLRISAGGLVFIGSVSHERCLLYAAAKGLGVYLHTSIDVRCVIISRIVAIAFQPVL